MKTFKAGQLAFFYSLYHQLSICRLCGFCSLPFTYCIEDVVSELLEWVFRWMSLFPLASATHIRTAEAVAEGVGDILEADDMVVENGVALVGGNVEVASVEDGDGAFVV